MKTFGKPYFLRKTQTTHSKKLKYKKRIVDENTAKFLKEDLNKLCSLLDLKFSELKLKEMKNKRRSSTYYYLLFEDLCKNSFYTKRNKHDFMLKNQSDQIKRCFTISLIEDISMVQYAVCSIHQIPSIRLKT